MKLEKGLITLLGAVTISFMAYGQNQCKESLYEANKLYEDGKMVECIARLKPCADNLGRDQKSEAYHLLALASLGINNLAETQTYIRKMLLANPDYQKFPNIDPVEFSRLVNQYKVSPKLSMGIKTGFNRNSVALKKSYSAYESTQSYLPVTGFQFGVTADYRLKPAVSLNADLLYTGLGINHVIDNAGGWKQNYNEQQNYFMFSLSFQYHYVLNKRIEFHAGLGLGVGYLYRSNVFFETTNLQTESTQQSTQNPIEMRNRIQTNGFGIFGISTPLAKGKLGIEASFHSFFGTTVNPEKRMNDLNFIFNNQYVNDDVSLRLMMINISYKLPILWSVKMKNIENLNK